jgi:hypothetical protein
MSELMPPRSLSVTTAAVLALTTGCYWLGVIGLSLWEISVERNYLGFPQRLIVLSSVLGCMSAGTVIVGFGLLFRRNWGRIFAILLAGPWILFGWNFLKPFLRLPASLGLRALFIALNALPIVAGIAWLALLTGKRIRSEFRPPSIVQIYVNLLNEGTPCSRPTQALALGNGLFELLPTEDYDPDDEHWEFLPGSLVRGMEAHRDGEPYLLAVSLGS